MCVCVFVGSCMREREREGVLSSKFSLSRLVSLRLFFSELVLDVHLNAVSIHTYIHIYMCICIFVKSSHMQTVVGIFLKQHESISTDLGACAHTHLLTLTYVLSTC